MEIFCNNPSFPDKYNTYNDFTFVKSGGKYIFYANSVGFSNIN